MTDTRTPLDTLRAALELVEQQLAAATPGPWHAEDEHSAIRDGIPSWVVSQVDHQGGFLSDVAYMPQYSQTEAADATLIVTGVNLLPVVRDILADAIRYREQSLPGTGAALRLARAIVKDGDLT